MREPEEKDPQRVLRKMKKICRVIRACFLGLAVLLAISLIALAMATLVGPRSAGNNELTSVLYTVIGGSFAVLILWNFSQLFGDVVKDEPPFSGIQADRLKAIAVVALAYFFLDLLFSAGFIYEPNPDLGFGMILNNGIAEPTLNLNVGMLAFSAIMYSLSAIFRYAALLQQLSDDTV